MKGTKLILSAIILASLAACSTGDGARKQRDFCYQEGTFHNICKTGADTTGTAVRMTTATTITTRVMTIRRMTTATITKVMTTRRMTRAMTTKAMTTRTRIKTAIAPMAVLTTSNYRTDKKACRHGRLFYGRCRLFFLADGFQMFLNAEEDDD